MSVSQGFVQTMYHLAGLPITNDFAKRIGSSHSLSDDMVFKGVKDSDKKYDWTISYGMITKSPLLSVTTAEIDPYIMGDIDVPDYPENILDKSSKTNKVEFISDFTTTQLKPKTKRLKLSIN
jgi:acetyl-CoA acetyltransferase